jgi:hypothetical protein
MRVSLRLLVLSSALVAALALAAPAGAIVNGTPDTEHPYVGLLLTDVDGDLSPVCSGTLIAPTVFLTAAHCTAFIGERPAYVSFDQQFTASSPLVSGTAVLNPDFGTSFPNTHDIAVVLLDEPVTHVGFADLPRAGLLDSLVSKKGKQNRSLTIVGYGSEGLVKGAGKPTHSFPLVRNMATAMLVNLTSANTGGFNLQLSSNPGRGQGGICFGDSGGPVLHGTSDTIVGINSFVNNANCTGTAFAYRVDTRASLAFLANYL